MKQILIVDNNRSVAAAVAARLKAADYATLLAADAVEAVGLAVQHKPDLTIVTLSLPGETALVVAEWLAKIPETKATPLIFLNPHQNEDLGRKALAFNPVVIVEKPYDLDDISAAARKALNHGAVNGRPTPAPGNRHHPKRARARILIVEDDEKIATALALRMKAAGYEPVLAFDAVLGMSTATRTTPDLVVLDISMPGGNGLDLAEVMQSTIPEPPPIIFLTASKQPGLRQRAESLGASAFFEKPYEAEDLMAAIKSALASENGSVSYGSKQQQATL